MKFELSLKLDSNHKKKRKKKRRKVKLKSQGKSQEKSPLKWQENKHLTNICAYKLVL
ncbi:hypothetical protein HMPREF1576_00777 [Gardnerella pickettii JCP7719]|uniref:Uncharacterized protein n=1 Tax=Gardnerella pickettii JCP7719 TaxID=1261061 RepID=S4I826_9BIFI|nr:hypothetical protein HMPREF1576_00777 [Gardnerella pickettii JCP7719]